MKLVKPYHPHYGGDVANVFPLDHAKAEKAAFLERERDAEAERRRYSGDRILQTFGWFDLGALIWIGLWNVLAVLGLAWLIGRLIASVESGVWL